MQTTIERDLEITLETALMLSEDGATIRGIAERIYDSESSLMAEVSREWCIERLVWMLKRRRANVAQSQLPLPGFQKLPSRITIKNNRRAALRFATLRELKEYRAHLWKKQDARVAPLDRLIEIVASYAVEEPNIRVVEAMERESKRR